MEQIFGKGVSKGVAAGPISFYRRPSGEIPRRSVTDTAAELARFHDACETAKEQLGVLHDKALAEAGEDAAMLFETHQMMLDDLDFVESIEGLIENDRLNAEAAVSDTGAQFAEMFAAMDDSYMQARAADIRDISTRVVGILTGEGESGIVSAVPCIVAADDLAPSETVQLDKSLILGFITAGGSANSHTAILARTMGIPAIIGAGDALQAEMEGKYAIIDGQTGETVIEPDDAERERLLKKQAKEKALKELLDQLKGKPNETRDGRNVMVYCNIGSPADIDAVLQNDGGGIGLFRSEFLYLQGSDYPTEDEQFEAYKHGRQARYHPNAGHRRGQAGRLFPPRQRGKSCDGSACHPHLSDPARGVPHAAARTVPRLGVWQNRYHVPDDYVGLGGAGDQAYLPQHSGRACEGGGADGGQGRARHYDRDTGRRHDERRAGA